MTVTYGRRCPKGHLPVGSVETEEDAKKLIARCCELVTVGRKKKFAYVARELEREQNFQNLSAFGCRLEAEYLKMLEKRKQK